VELVKLTILVDKAETFVDLIDISVDNPVDVDVDKDDIPVDKELTFIDVELDKDVIADTAEEKFPEIKDDKLTILVDNEL
jgi:hypothetical protein